MIVENLLRETQRVPIFVDCIRYEWWLLPVKLEIIVVCEVIVQAIRINIIIFFVIIAVLAAAVVIVIIIVVIVVTISVISSILRNILGNSRYVTRIIVRSSISDVTVKAIVVVCMHNLINRQFVDVLAIIIAVLLLIIILIYIVTCCDFDIANRTRQSVFIALLSYFIIIIPSIFDIHMTIIITSHIELREMMDIRYILAVSRDIRRRLLDFNDF